MKIIRCLWGKEDHQFKEKDLKFYHDECYTAKSNDDNFGLDNQIVIVWDKINCDLMEKIGYPYYYMGDSGHINIELNFMYKILALKKAMELYDEILFLDWDFYIQKRLDNNFYELLKKKGDVQIPVYFYPKELLDLFKKMDQPDKEISNYYNSLYHQMIIHSKWKFQEGIVIPNAGFIYCKDKQLFNNILDIQKKHNITTNIEEICLMIHFNGMIFNLDEYIQKIEPIVCHGKIDSEMMGKQVLLNNYTNEKLSKNIYFNHI